MLQEWLAVRFQLEATLASEARKRRWLAEWHRGGCSDAQPLEEPSVLRGTVISCLAFVELMGSHLPGLYNMQPPLSFLMVILEIRVILLVLWNGSE